MRRSIRQNNTVALLAGCAVQEVQLPDRVIEVKTETALAAQEAALQEILAGGEIQINMTEEEFSSLVTALVTQNSGEFNIVEEIKVWFEEDGQFTAQISLLDGTLPESYASDDIVIKGTLEGTAVQTSAYFNGPQIHRFGLAVVAAQEAGDTPTEEAAEEAAKAADEATDEATDEAEKALEEQADEAEKALEDKADAAEQQMREKFGITLESISVGGVALPEGVLSIVSEQMNFALSFLEDFYSSVLPAAGEININL